MQRRDVLAVLTALAGGSLLIPPALLSGCRREAEGFTPAFFTKEEMALLEQAAETILPTTPDSPGARDAGIGPFMDSFVADCLDPDDQAVLRAGLQQLDQRAQEQAGQPFLKLAADGQHDLLVAFDIEAEAYQKALQPEQPPHYFTLLKGLTLLGFFTSETGATEVLRYVPVPGKYEGDVPYKEGEKAWAIDS